MATKLLPPSERITSSIPASQNWGAEDDWWAELDLTPAQRERLYEPIVADPTGKRAVDRVMARQKPKAHRTAKGRW